MRRSVLSPLCDCGHHFTWEGAWHCLRQAREKTPEKKRRSMSWLPKLAIAFPGYKPKSERMVIKKGSLEFDDPPEEIIGPKVVIYRKDKRILVTPPEYDDTPALVKRLQNVDGYKKVDKSSEGACSFPAQCKAAVKLVLSEFFPGATVVDREGNNQGNLPQVMKAKNV